MVSYDDLEKIATEIENNEEQWSRSDMAKIMVATKTEVDNLQKRLYELQKLHEKPKPKLVFDATDQSLSDIDFSKKILKKHHSKDDLRDYIFKMRQHQNNTQPTH